MNRFDTAPTPRQTALTAAGFALLYLLGSLYYNLTTPIFEGPDTIEHFAFVRYLADHWHIPDAIEEYGTYDRMATQGPVYYIAAALAIQPLELSDTRPLPPTNPFSKLAEIDALGNKNGFVHDAEIRWPGVPPIVAAVHVAQVVSGLFGALAVVGGVLIGARFSWRVALLMGALAALLPQFVALGGLVTNDTASAGLATLALWLMLRYWEQPGYGRAALLGLMIGLAGLSKVGGFGLLAIAAGAVLVRRWRDWRAMFSEGPLILIVALAVSAPWLWMNYSRYGDPTGMGAHYALSSGELRDYGDPAVVFAAARMLLYSTWGLFGPINIAAPPWVYLGLMGLALASVAGLAVAAPQTRKHPALWLALAWLALLSIPGFSFAYSRWAWYGRYWFTALPGLLLPVALGLDAWLKRSNLAWGLLALPAGMAAFTALAPLLLIRPVFAPSPIMAALPGDTQPVCLTFGGDLHLLGVRVADDDLQPGEVLDVTYYWRSDRPQPGQVVVFLRALDADLQPIIKENTYHGHGAFPTTLWAPGVIYADRYRLRVPADVPTPVYAPLVIQLEAFNAVLPRTCNGEPVDDLTPLAAVRIAGPPEPLAGESVAEFGGQIALVDAGVPAEATPGETLALTLDWQVSGAAEPGLRRFVHLGTADTVLAQDDAVAARFPSIAWRVGDRFDERVSLALPDDLPPGEYTVYVGLYGPDGQRLATHSEDNRAVLGTVTVEK